MSTNAVRQSDVETPPSGHRRERFVLGVVIGVLIIGLIGVIGLMEWGGPDSNAAVEVPEVESAAKNAISPFEEAQRFTDEWYLNRTRASETGATLSPSLTTTERGAYFTEQYWEAAEPAYFTERYWKMAEARAIRSARAELRSGTAVEPATFTEPYWRLADAYQAKHDLNSAAPSGAYYTEKYWLAGEPDD